jgi:hypothetical protein
MLKEIVTKNGFPLISGNENHHGDGFGSFSMDDIGRFNFSDQLGPSHMEMEFL